MPHEEIRGHGHSVRCLPPSDSCENNQPHQREPEEAVGRKGGGPEGVVFLPFENPCDHLSDPSVKNPDGQDHCSQRDKSRIVQVQKHGRHTKPTRPSGAGLPVVSLILIASSVIGIAITFSIRNHSLITHVVLEERSSTRSSSFLIRLLTRRAGCKGRYGEMPFYNLSPAN